MRKRRGTGSLITRLHGIREERFGNGRCKHSAGFRTPNAQVQLTNQLGLKRLHPEEGSVPKMSFIFLWDQDTIWVNLLGSFPCLVYSSCFLSCIPFSQFHNKKQFLSKLLFLRIVHLMVLWPWEVCLWEKFSKPSLREWITNAVSSSEGTTLIWLRGLPPGMDWEQGHCNCPDKGGF